MRSHAKNNCSFHPTMSSSCCRAARRLTDERRGNFWILLSIFPASLALPTAELFLLPSSTCNMKLYLIHAEPCHFRLPIANGKSMPFYAKKFFSIHFCNFLFLSLYFFMCNTPTKIRLNMSYSYGNSELYVLKRAQF